MSPHRALLLDADDDFLALLKRSLEPCGLSVLQIRDPEEVPLEPFLAEPPDLIFISVDLPDKKGFSVFTRVRSLAKRVPIALATSSLSAIEMSLHAKLRLHADLYLNKRALDPALLLATLRPLLPGVAGLAAEASRHVPMRSLPDGTGSIPVWLSDGPDEGEVQAVLAGFPDGPAAGGGVVDASDWEVGRRIAELEAEREQLRRELAQARRDASSSPFSAEVASQREENSRYTADLSRLQFEVGHRDRELAELRLDLGNQAEELGRALHERREVLVGLMQLEAQLEEARCGLRRLGKERLAVEEARAAERERSQKELAEQRERDAETLFQAQLELEQLRSTLREREENAECSRRVHADEVAELRGAKERAIANLEKRWATRLELAEREHAAALQAACEQHADALRTLESSHRAALVHSEHGAEAEQSRAIGGFESQAQAGLEKVRRARAVELEALRSQQAEEMQKLEAGHCEALGRMEREHREAIRQALAAQEAAAAETLKEMQRTHADQLASVHQHYARERQSREADHAAMLNHNQVELEAAINQAVRGSRSDLQRQLEQAQRDHDETIASLQRHHVDERRRFEQEQQAARKAWRGAEARVTELRRVDKAQRADVEALGAALASAQRQAVEQASALAAQERELADRAASIASLEALVEDLQRIGLCCEGSGAVPAESAPGRGGAKA